MNGRTRMTSRLPTRVAVETRMTLRAAEDSLHTTAERLARAYAAAPLETHLAIAYGGVKIGDHDLLAFVQRCLVDAVDGELAIARSMADAPEIDGLVQIQNGLEAGCVPGQFVDVDILGSDDHDLYGEVA